MFCHSSVVKYASSLLQQRGRYETVYQILLKSLPLNVLTRSALGARSCFHVQNTLVNRLIEETKTLMHAEQTYQTYKCFECGRTECASLK